MKQTQLIMGMPITVEIVGLADQAAQIIDQAFTYFRQVDETFSTYKSNSQISRLDRGEFSLGDCDPEVRLVLAACDEMTSLTNGYFDINHNGHLDPSGYVKGWAIEEVAKLMAGHGVKDFFIEAGGDIQASGHNAHSQPWRVGLRHPSQLDKYAKVITITDGAVATSGTYERGQHIYNPHTNQRATEILSITVIGPSITRTDVLATAAFAMGPARGLKFIQDQAHEGMAITTDEQVISTPGFDHYVVRD